MTTTTETRIDTQQRPGQDELRMLGLLARGVTLDATARHLAISPRTVRRRMRTLQTRLGVTSPIEAIVHAARHDWI